MPHLTLVTPTHGPDELADALYWQSERAKWLDALAPDRSRYRGSAGVEAMKRFKPLSHDEQACADRAAEKTRLAKEEHVSVIEIWKALWKGDVVR